MRAHYFDADEAYARREEMNLLYVAMTRAKQALLVSGNGEPTEESWYGRIAAAVQQHSNPLRADFSSPLPRHSSSKKEADKHFAAELITLRLPIPTGKRVIRSTAEQQRGTWLHALLQHLAPSLKPSDGTTDKTTSHSAKPQSAGQAAGYSHSTRLSKGISQVAGYPEGRGKQEFQQRCGIPPNEIDSLWQQAQHLLALPHLQRFFGAQHYRSASNEMPYVNARSELKRIDRLVEFDDEVWVLDYKTGARPDVAPYRAQMQEYRVAMQAVYEGKTVRCALLFADGILNEL
jgi:ATP-dependent helicase/nuclease subunit A